MRLIATPQRAGFGCALLAMQRQNILKRAAKLPLKCPLRWYKRNRVGPWVIGEILFCNFIIIPG
jgi:hypothetical protein